MGGEVFVLVGFTQAFASPSEQGTTPPVSGGQEQIKSLNDGGGGVGAVGGLAARARTRGISSASSDDDDDFSSYMILD